MRSVIYTIAIYTLLVLTKCFVVENEQHFIVCRCL